MGEQGFVDTRTEGFEALIESVKDSTPEVVEKITGVSAGDLVESCPTLLTVSQFYHSLRDGITQHVTGTNNVLALANLAMVTGQIGKASSGVNPLRGQNNVQGACDVGGSPMSIQDINGG